MLSRFWKLAPVESGPWWRYRQRVVDQLREMDVRPGDIICRLGNYYVYGYFWFSKFIAHLTRSKYSHAAMVIDTSDDILLADVGTSGLKRQFAADWVDDVRGDEITVLRYMGDPLIPQLAVENVRNILTLDFLDSEEHSFYCVELVCWCYLRAGVSLCDEVTINELPNWKRWLNPVARVHGININKKVWCVGNEKIGLMSSPHLYEVGRIKCKGVYQESECLTFRGA
jgi:hypothetical protein